MIADCSHRMMLTRALAVFVVVLLLSSSLATLLMYESEALEDYQHSVVYHSNLPGEGSESVTVIYDGIASAEYNPEFGIGENGTVWKDTEGGIVTANVTISVSFVYRGNSQETFTVGLSNLPDGYTIDSVSCTGDFESWSQTEDSLIISSDRGWSLNHRGTVEMNVSFPCDYEHKVFGGWSTSKDGNVDYLPGEIIPDDVGELYAVWIVPTLTTATSMVHSSRETTSYSIPSLEVVQEILYSQRGDYTTLYDSGTALGRIYVIDGYVTAPSSLPSGTYRTQNDAVMQINGNVSMMQINGNVSIDGDVIIDNLRLSSSSGENHGDGDNGLFANGHMLILGPGVSSSGGSSPTSYLQVYGGHWRNVVTPDGGSTDVRIFAGTFYNVVAGSRGSTIYGDTHLVMRGGTVLDTVIGGNSGNSGDSNANSVNRITGSTHVYMLGDVIMPGDYYEEDALGNSSMFDGLPQISESTILTGGSNNGYIGGGTNVFISNNAQLWDVQAGGRRGNSTVEGTAMAEVSGNAVVKHVLCGSITDGMDGKNASPGNDKACVGATDIRVTDGAKVGSVFGAGYDTYYPATYASMVGQDTTISITIDGSSVVGYVYGGGYRGTIGSESSPIGSISITISGGTVLGDVFGGGRGGLDKPIHNSTGGISDTKVSDSIRDSTGYSKVYVGSITISVTGGTVEGSVYGGGESVPVLGGYNGFSLSNEIDSQREGVAEVHAGSISVNVTGGSVGGSVYGAGKGVDTGETVTVGGTEYHESAFIFAIKVDGELELIPWTTGYGGTSVWGNADHSDYASTEGNVSVDVSGAKVGDSVYGGGEMGRLGPESGTGGTIEVTIGSGAEVARDVLAGGYGQSGVLSTNTVYKTIVLNGSDVGGDVYGGSRFGDDNIYGGSTLAQSDTVIRLVSGTVGGSVYGGGYQGGSYSNVTMDIGEPAATNDTIPSMNEATVGGSVYGGGYQGSVLGDVSIDIAGDDGLAVRITDSVYGGGYLGTVGPVSGSSNNTLVMSIGANVTIGGSVYGGGYGETDSLSTNILTRTITVNGPTIRGSVYGGSRFGDDNCSGSGGNVYTNGGAILYIISGDIAAGSSGNIYGGGYRGYSAMDTSVYVGVPATEASGSDPLSGTLRIGSIYGGSSVGESSNYQSDAELLIGDTMVRIGNLDPDTRGSVYTDFSITGDVFGEGDYCAITGESSVTFTAFDQGGSMLSVQKADILDVIGSSLVLEGNVDGSDTQASERLSLNLIGDLRLQRLDGHVSSLDMKAAASQIGGYGSLDESGDPIVYSDTETDLNRITLRDGMMMSILGEGNNGLSADMNEIRGFTILDNGGDSYYGTFAMGPTDLVQNGLTGFMIETDDVLVAAQEGHYTFYYSDGTGSTQPVSMTMWFIAGVYKVETTMVLQDVTGEDVISAEDDVMAPKTVSNSTISFVGGYVNADSQGSLNLVGSTDENPGTDFQVLVGGKRDANHIYFNEGDGVVAFPDSSVRFDGSGIYLNVKVSTKSGFDTTGYAGTVTLHMVEYIGDIPINMFDVEVSIYLRVTSDIPTITETIVMRASGSRKYGTTDVYLPVLGANHMAEYTIKLLGAEGETEGVFVDIEGTLTLETVATNLNKNGWQSTEHSGEIEPVRGQDTVLGVGGVFAPVIRFDYTADEPFQEIHLELTIQDESGGTPKVYTIILQPESAEYVELSFYDKYLMYDEGSDSISWSQWAQGADGGYLDPVFVLQLQFGMRLDTIKIAVSESFLGGTIGGTAIEGLDTKGYIDMVREAISEASSTEGWYGDVLLLQSDMDPGSPVSTVLCGDESYVEERLVDLGIRDEYRVMGVEEFLDEYVSMKPGTDYRDGSSDETFEYSRHYNWYDTHECITEFRFSSKISNDLDVFAGYTITVTVIPFTDMDNPDAGGDYTVTPSTTMIIPGEDVDLGHVLSSLTITPGYGASGDPMWYSKGDDVLSEIEKNSDGRYVITPRVDTVVYLMLERESYGITLVINGKTQAFPADYGVEVTGCVEGAEHSTSSAHFGDSVEVTFQWTDGYHIGSISGTTQLGGFPGLTHSRTDGEGTDTYTVSFDMPSSALTITIEMTDKRSVTFEMADDSGTSDNGRFGLGELEDSGDRISVYVSDSLSTKSRTITTNTDSATLAVDSDLGTGVLVTVDVNGVAMYVRVDPSTVRLDLSDAGEEVTVTIQVNVKWSLTTSGEGYDVAINGQGYGSANLPGYVLTGDVLTVRSTSDSSLTDITYSGVRSDGHDADFVWTFTVNGTGDVSLRLPVFSVVLTIDLGFMLGNQQVTLSGGWYPDGTLTVTKDDGIGLRVGEPTVVDGRLVYTMTVESGSYTVSAKFGGFSPETVTIEVTSGSTSEVVTLDAIEYTVHVRPSTSGSFDRTVPWYAVGESGGVWGYSTDTVGSIGSDADAAAWFLSVNEDMSDAEVAGEDEIITVGMFVDGAPLYLLAVPGLDGEEGEVVDPPEFHAVIVVVDGEVNGSHVIDAVDGLADGTYTATAGDGSTVTLTYSDKGDGTATVVVSGCPAGLGGLALMCSNGEAAFNLLLYSVPDLGAIA